MATTRKYGWDYWGWNLSLIHISGTILSGNQDICICLGYLLYQCPQLFHGIAFTPSSSLSSFTPLACFTSSIIASNGSTSSLFTGFMPSTTCLLYTSCGIDEVGRHAIFERFVKMNYNIKGTGLGLSITKSIVEHYGGCLLYTSRCV